MTPTGEQAYELLLKYNKDESLIRHALAVEGVMLHFAELFGEEDVLKWGVIGLIHDLDYEQYPDRHCTITEKILREENWPEEYIRAAVSHGWKICSDTEPVHVMEKVLYTIDEHPPLQIRGRLPRFPSDIFQKQATMHRRLHTRFRLRRFPKYTRPPFPAGCDRRCFYTVCPSLASRHLGPYRDKPLKFGTKAATR